jgi:hypothetical protein
MMQTECNVSSVSNRWRLCGGKFPKSEVVFFVQVILIYIVVITSLVNISLGEKDQLWILLLTSSIGYLLPNPTLRKDGRPVPNSPQ